VSRFDRTYRAHDVSQLALRLPMVVFLSIYYPARALRALSSSR
jgi:hypothetical protein